jgi:hypothetical protein
LAKDATIADAIVSLSLHPTVASIDNRFQQRPLLPRPPLTATSVNNDRNCCRCQQTMTASFWRLLLLTVWQRQWRLSTSAIASIVDGSCGGIELRALMAASLTMAAVDGGSDNGVSRELGN